MADEAAVRRRTGDVRSALLDTAERVLEEHGETGLTIRAVATEAGVAPMGVYNHLQSKDGLVLALVARGFDRLAEVTIWRSTVAPDEAFRAVGHAYRQFALNAPNLYALMFGAPTRSPEFLTEVGSHADNSFNRLVEVVRAAQFAGVVRPGDAEELAVTTWASLHGLVSLEASHSISPQLDSAKLFEATLDLIVKGLS